MYVTVYLNRPNRNEEIFVIDTNKLNLAKDKVEQAVNRQDAYVELDVREVNYDLLPAKAMGITHLTIDVHQVN